MSGSRKAADVTDLGASRPASGEQGGDDGYRAVFEQLPIGLLEEDWSAVKRAIDEARTRGELRAWLTGEPALALELAESVRVRDFNAAAMSIFRASRPDAFRRAVAELRSAGQQPWFVDTLCRLAASEGRVVIEDARLAADGTTICVRDTVFIPREHRRDWRRVIHSLEDVTEQRATDLRLRRNQERMRMLLESVRAIPWEADARTWRHTYVGPQAVDILGYPQEAWYQKNFWLDHVHPDDRLLARRFVDMHRSEPRDHALEYRMLDRGGRTVWLHDTVRPVSAAGGTRLLRGFMVDITSHKRVEHDFEQQRMLLRAIFESAPDGLVVENRDREIILCNSGFARLFGYPTDQLVGKQPRMLYAHQQEFIAQGRMRFNPGASTSPTPFVTTFRRASGETFAGEVVSSHIRGPGGETLGYVATIRDITERQGVEAALEFRRQFQNIVVDVSKRFINLDAESIDAGICEALGAIGLFADVDRGFVCLFRPEAELVSNTHEWCAEGVASTQARWSEVSYDAMPRITERQRNGEIVHVPRVADLPAAERVPLDAEGIHSFITVPLESHGEVLGFLGLDSVRREMAWAPDTISLLSIVAQIVVNALDRKRQDDALRQSEARLQAIMDNSPALIFLKDLAGRYLVISRMHEELFGLNREEVRGKTIRELLPEVDAVPIASDDEEVIRTRQLIEREREIGDRIYASVKFPIYDGSGEVVAIGGVGHDITERKRMEQQLRQAQKMEAVGQLTGGVAHDFNNLLTVLLGNLQMLQVGVAHDVDLSELTRTAVAAATSGAQLTQRLLSFSRRQLPESELVPVGEVVEALRPLLRRTLDESMELELHAPPDTWSTVTDRTELQGALLNLAINARDAMESGGRLTIETANLGSYGLVAEGGGRSRGEYVTIAVADTGCGIPASTLDRVIEPFYSTKETGKGTGLGLSMVYGFVKRCGGHIDIDSAPGKGTRVTLFLPRAQEGPACARSHRERAEGMVTGSETILVVEDQPLVLRTVSRMLRRLGYDVLEAESAPLALSLLETHPEIALLLTDIVMPGGMTGLELARELELKRPNLKVIYTTGYAGMTELDEASPRDAIVLRKPYEHEELASRIRQVLDD